MNVYVIILGILATTLLGALVDYLLKKILPEEVTAPLTIFIVTVCVAALAVATWATYVSERDTVIRIVPDLPEQGSSIAEEKPTDQSEALPDEQMHDQGKESTYTPESTEDSYTATAQTTTNGGAGSSLPATQSIEEPSIQQKSEPAPTIRPTDTQYGPTDSLVPATPTPWPTKTPVPPTPKPTKTPRPPTSIPEATAGSLAGRVLWNDNPVSDIRVDLYDRDCVDFLEERVYSDSTGNYQFGDLTPGSYAIRYNLAYGPDDAGADRDYSSGCYWSISVRAGEVTAVDVNIGKTDLIITNPLDDATTSTTPTISWAPYSHAAYYQIKASDGVGNERIDTASGTDYVFSSPLDAGTTYFISVWAYNSKDHLLSWGSVWIQTNGS